MTLISRLEQAEAGSRELPCTLGVGCDESGVCYASANNRPDMCPKRRPVKFNNVTQLDRDAAADLWSKFQNMTWADWQEGWMRDGTADRGPVVQAFAAHHIASLKAAGYE